MSVIREAIDAIKGTLLLADKVERVGHSLKTLADEVTNHERRLIRLEAKWETAIELGSLDRTKRIQG